MTEHRSTPPAAHRPTAEAAGPDAIHSSAGPGLSPARAAVLVAAVVTSLALLVPWPSAGAAELDGKKLFLREKCNVCHGVSSADIEATVKAEKMRGPDLARLEEAPDPEALLTYLRQQSEIDGKKHKKAFKGSDEELAALVLWLEEQHEAGAGGGAGGR